MREGGGDGERRERERGREGVKEREEREGGGGRDRGEKEQWDTAKMKMLQPCNIAVFTYDQWYSSARSQLKWDLLMF